MDRVRKPAQPAKGWKRPLVLILALGLILSLASAIFTPPWQVPDEPQHFQLAVLLRDLSRWPTLSDVYAATGLRDGVYTSLVRHRFWEIRAHRSPPPSLWEDTSPDVLLPPIYVPPAYYALAAGVIAPFKGLSLDGQLLALRVASALLGFLALVLIYRMSRLAFEGNAALSLAAMALAAFLPMRVVITGGVTNDVLAGVWGAVAVYAMVAWVRRPLMPARGAALGLLLALALLTKRTTVFLLPLVVVFLVLNRRRTSPRPSATPLGLGEGMGERSAHGSKFGWWPGVALGAICLAAPLAAWMLLRPPLTVPGQPWPYPGSTAGGLLGVRAEWVLRVFTPDAWTLSALRGYAVSLGVAFASFWGDFGWLTIPLDVGWYAVLAALAALSVAGVVRWLRRRNESRPEMSLILWAGGLALLEVIAAAVGQNVPQQGRYLLPVLGPLACALVLGWAEWLPARARRFLPLAVGSGMLALVAVSWFGYMRPAFYGG